MFQKSDEVIIVAPCEMFYDAFKLHDRHGVSLSLLLQVAELRNIDVSIPAFYLDAIRGGWSAKKAKSIVREALYDVGKDSIYVECAITFLGLLCIEDDAKKLADSTKWYIERYKQKNINKEELYYASYKLEAHA